MKNKLYLIVISLLVAQSGLAQEPQQVRSNTMFGSPDSPANNRSVIELLNRLDQLQTELRQLRGDMEVVNHELDGIKKRQRELYLDMDRRLNEVELASVRTGQPASINDQASQATGQQSPTAQAAQQVSSVISPAAIEAAKVQPPSRQEKDEYRSAFNLLKEGRYDRSIKAFASFLAQYPSSTYADNAQYWLGEANYVSRKYPEAVREFDKVISAFPDSTKVPDAMLKLGFTHYELKEWGKAREMLTAVVQNYPKSSAAKLADTRLKRLQSEGH